MYRTGQMALALTMAVLLYIGLKRKDAETFEAASLAGEQAMSARVVYQPEPVTPLFIHPLQRDSQLAALSLRYSATLPTVRALPDGAARGQTLRYTDMVTFYDAVATDSRLRFLTTTRTPFRAVFITKRNRTDRPFTVLDITTPPRLVAGATGPRWLASAILDAAGVKTLPSPDPSPNFSALWESLINETVFLLLTEESPLWDQLLNLQDPFDFVPYKAIDIDRLRVRLPFARPSSTLVVTNGNAASMTTQALSFDGVLWGDQDIRPNPAMAAILETLDRGSTNSYYAPLFRLYSITERLGLAKAKTVEGFASAGPREEARDKAATLHIYDELQLRLEPDGRNDYRGVLAARSWHGVTLQAGDRLRLYDQRPAHHSGYYYVLRVGYNDAELATYIPGVTPELRAPAPWTLLEGDRVALALTDGRRGRLVAQTSRPGSLSEAAAAASSSAQQKVASVSGLRFEPDAPAETETSRSRDPEYMCFSSDGFPLHGVLSEEECKKKTSGVWDQNAPHGVWDRPCRHDTECPFYRGSVNNHKGGCQSSGYCEMPVGVKATSYRTYSGSPDCSGCAPGVDPAACCARPGARLAFKRSEEQ